MKVLVNQNQNFQPVELTLKLESPDELNILHGMFNTPRNTCVLGSLIDHERIRRALEECNGFNKNKAYKCFKKFRDYKY